MVVQIDEDQAGELTQESSETAEQMAGWAHNQNRKSVILQSNDSNSKQMAHQPGTQQAMATDTGGALASLTPLQLIDRSRVGIAGSEADQIARLLGVTDKEMAPLLNQSIATFHRQAKAGRLDASTSERLLLLGRLAHYGATVFQDQGKFTRWLRRPLRLLGDRSPLDLMDSPTGVQLVEDILGRIEYGVYS